MTNITPDPDNENQHNYYGEGAPTEHLSPAPDTAYYPVQEEPAPQRFAGASEHHEFPDQQQAPQPYPAQPHQQAYPNQPFQHQQQMSNYGMLPVQSPTNKNAIISLVVSLATFFIFCGIPLVGTAAAIVGIVFGHKALKETTNTPDSGHGVALAGVICGYVALVMSILVGAIVLLYIGLAMMGHHSSY